MATFTEIRRKYRKMSVLMRNAVWREGARKGVAAAIEHRHALADLDFQTCIDVGANRGQFSMLIRGLKPECRIHAFEPLDSPAKTFELVHGDCANVELHRFALGEAADQMPIQITAKDDSSSFLDFDEVKSYGSMTDKVGEKLVDIRRLDAVFRDEDLVGATLLKLDVQGFEDKVLRGATGLLPSIEWIYTEFAFVPLYDGQPLFNDLHTLLSDMGYEPRRIGHVSGIPNNVQCTGDILYQRR